MAKKYYAVKNGRKTGIYTSWDACKKQIQGFSGAVFKGFLTREEAENYLGESVNLEKTKGEDSSDNIEETGNFAFVDGSYNQLTKVYGYGGFLIADGKKYVLKGNGKDVEMASMRNVAGEILGCLAAVEKAIALELSEITVYYDYMGIEMWASGLWKRNKKGTIDYYNIMQEYMKKIKVNFKKVKGHSGIEGNEEADHLAKEAVGIHI